MDSRQLHIIGSITAVVLMTVNAGSLLRGDENKSTVRVEVWTAAGRYLDGVSLRLLKLDKEEDISQFRNGVASGVPYGEYRLRIRQPGFRWYEQTLIVLQPDVSVQVKLTVSFEHFPRYARLDGTATPASKELWIKLVPIISNGTPVIETRVQEDGRFELVGMDNGEYLLIVTKGTRVITTKEVVINGDSRVQIALPAN